VAPGDLSYAQDKKNIRDSAPREKKKQVPIKKSRRENKRKELGGKNLKEALYTLDR